MFVSFGRGPISLMLMRKASILLEKKRIGEGLLLNLSVSRGHRSGFLSPEQVVNLGLFSLNTDSSSFGHPGYHL